MSLDTIAAVATAPGRGGVGIVRVSGPGVPELCLPLVGQTLKPRHAHYCDFLDKSGQVLDQGIALYFPSPNSFTGEDVLELQGHGGPVILDLLLQHLTQLGVRLARPGEFSERAFLNDKLDLAQAEAIADLIDAGTEQAARNALRSLQGAFSVRIQELVEALIQLRIYVEAAIDFPEEEIDFLTDGKVATDLAEIKQRLNEVFAEARQGVLMRDGMHVVIAGRPNAGKSSLLNALSGRDSAIVTSIEGTTRDLVREHIHIDGMPLHIIDTAGLRDSPDEVEKIGIARAWEEIQRADRLLLLVDGRETESLDPAEVWPEFVNRFPSDKITLVRNKIDLTGEPAGIRSETHPVCIGLSTVTSEGLEALKTHLKQLMGYDNQSQGGFTARRRHLDALERASISLDAGQAQLQSHAAGELLAEDLRQAQEALSEITGQFTSDDLLGRIFGSFCIGK
ncbi:tRNA uridine-5-carboxymethylaminomethyl(34) synthesis GTPase MnmE [Marinimicrobium sp. ABcell2]|uniref:tRNA uridine-5-carboxymethylaminomethyl(34) synthesis GTPase MnmE n=1 Tax=Marinimicrobium sp. ABcell2 TaxID=3069751 RepID=UPI0027B3CCB0|nr:tRNA uridine-5-carboxymethylaminomethyl(34) synthesis GTPase MnmE [Marinimicrobium sp. ABcell2]MDQ2077035.1 tRNA uridine-5-carboxymethylaminomethyl(34) synthesis GTPase MnmE [Marinimicrobium sp. ABcell2]